MTSTATDDEPLLHQWEISPFCGKVRKILRFKGIAWRTVNYPGLLARRGRRLTPAGQLPVLDWRGQRIGGSDAIAAYLEQHVPSPAIYPAEPRDAACARRYEDWAGASLYPYGMHFRVGYAAPREKSIGLLCEGRPAWERAWFGPVFRRSVQRMLDLHGFSRRDGREIEAAYLRMIDDLDVNLRGREWLVGPARSIADFAVSAQLDEMLRTSTLADRILLRPNVARWLASLA